MQKKITRDTHINIVNKTMSYIYKNIDSDINIDELAYEFNISKIHLHKIFKEQMKINIYESIKSIRLQKASNLLLTNKYSTITQIANMCGYSSSSSFIKAFKQRFNQTPKQWRNKGYEEYSNNILQNSLFGNYNSIFEIEDLKIIKTEARKIYYIRQKGYINKDAKEKWQQLQAWTLTNDIKDFEYIGIFHDNPAITPHENCFYIASICVKDDTNLINTNLPYNTIESGLYASFKLKSQDKELGWFIKWAYQEWLLKSNFETTTQPSFAIMHKNHFLEDCSIDSTFYLPIRSL